MPPLQRHSSPRSQFRVELACRRCGQTGVSVWEENAAVGTDGPQPILVSLSDGFYERLARKSPHAIELVCHRCEAVQPG